MRAKSLSGLPPAHIVSAGYDFLRDENEEYGRKLADDGVRVTITRYPGMVHGFFSMGGMLDEADVALAEVSDALRRAFRTTTAAAAQLSSPHAANDHELPRSPTAAWG
jgi:acetyl esterase